MTRFPTPTDIEATCHTLAARIHEAERTIGRLEYAIDRCRSYEATRVRRIQIGALREYLRGMCAYA